MLGGIRFCLGDPSGNEKRLPFKKQNLRDNWVMGKINVTLGFVLTQKGDKVSDIAYRQAKFEQNKGMIPQKKFAQRRQEIKDNIGTSL